MKRKAERDGRVDSSARDPVVQSDPKKRKEDTSSKWEKIWDTNYKQHYYYNSVTGKSVWEKPEDYVEERVQPSKRAPAQTARAEEGAKLYVGNLAYRTDDRSLHRAFSKYGDIVEATVVMDREDPTRSRGYGFVTFRSVSDAREACSRMDGYDIDGRRVRVNMSDRAERGGGGRGGRGMASTSYAANSFSQSRQAEDGSKLFVGSLSFRTDDRSLRAAFEKYGTIREASVVMERNDPSRSRGFGFVTFVNAADAAAAAAALNNREIDGRTVTVEVKGGGRSGGRESRGDVGYRTASSSSTGVNSLPVTRSDESRPRAASSSKTNDDPLLPTPAQAERESGGTNRRIYVAGLPNDAKVDDVQKLFGQIGQVQRIKQRRGFPDQWPWKIKMYTDDKGAFKGDCVVSFVDPNAAKSAPGFFDGYMFNGTHKISVQLAKAYEPKEGDEKTPSSGTASFGGDRRRGGYDNRRGGHGNRRGDYERSGRGRYHRGSGRRF